MTTPVSQQPRREAACCRTHSASDQRLKHHRWTPAVLSLPCLLYAASPRCRYGRIQTNECSIRRADIGSLLSLHHHSEHIILIIIRRWTIAIILTCRLLPIHYCPPFPPLSTRTSLLPLVPPVRFGLRCGAAVVVS